MKRITAIEVLEDFTATARCDEGFLHVRRLRCQNRRDDGSTSEIFRVDVVDRPRLDAVAVAVYRRSKGGKGIEVLTRKNLRPAAYFRKDKSPAIPDAHSHLFVDEIVAGLIEPGEKGEAALRRRAAAETGEEVGFHVEAAKLLSLGAATLLAPGILSEKLFFFAADVTGLTGTEARGDGSPLEEGGEQRWWELHEGRRACRDGRLCDAKTELAWSRLAETLNSPA